MADTPNEENQETDFQPFNNTDVYAATPSSGSGGDGEEEEENEKAKSAEEIQKVQVASVYSFLQNLRQDNDKNISEWVKQTSTVENSVENQDEISGIKVEGMEEDEAALTSAGDDELKSEFPAENDDAIKHEECGQNLQTTFKVFVSNLPPGLPNSELMELFQKYGEVAECEIFAKNYAFVHMLSEDAGLKALEELNGLDLRGCRINVKRSVQSGHPANKKTVVKKEPNPTTEAEPETLLEVGTFKIYIGNLHTDVTKEYVSQLLQPFGRTVEIEIYRNTSAFVHMETEEGGKKAIEELNGKSLPESEDEKSLVVSESKNPEGPSLPTIKLLVKNLSASVSPDELRNLFTSYGLVLKVSISTKTNPVGSGCRTAVVHLEQFGNIRSAIKDLTGKEVGGSAISVEAKFDKPKQDNSRFKSDKPAPFFKRPQPRALFEQKDPYEWTPVTAKPPSYPPRPEWTPPNKMRLIPMPSKAEMHKFPRNGRGRVPRSGGGPPPRPLMSQQPFWGSHSHGGYNNEGYEDYGNAGYEDYGNEGYEDYNNEGYDNYNKQHGYNEVVHGGGGFGGGYSNSNNYEDEEFNDVDEYDWSQHKGRNEFAPPPVKIPRNQSWNNSGNAAGNKNGWPPGKGNQKHFNSRSPSKSNRNNANNNVGGKSLFPQLPSQGQFPKVPQSLMAMQVSKPVDHDWSSDLPVSNFSTFDQDFSSDEPLSSTLNAVPFDYSQMKKKSTPMNTNNWQRTSNANAQQQRHSQGKGNQSAGRGRKGKSARRPGLGSAQQQKKLAHQTGNDEYESSNTVPGEWRPVSINSLGGGTTAPPSTNHAPPNYFQQNWSFSKGKQKQNNRKPTAKQMKEAEEEQKRQYSDYLKQKPWLYQAIPGTVKKVQQ